ncbi:MAG: bacteriohemerythrin [Bacteroidales bacterium]
MADFFVWNEEYSVHVKEIDDQHKVLIKLLNKLYNAFMKKEHSLIIGEIIQNLFDYASNHFQIEEKYFKRFNYRESVQHISEHQKFIEKINQFKIDFEKNNGALTFTIINFLRNWLISHIRISDKKYMDCFAQNGLK